MFVLSESQKKNNKYYITTTPELPWLFKENLSDEVNEENIKQAINKLGVADVLFLAYNTDLITLGRGGSSNIGGYLYSITLV